ncbi:DUF3134 domain-containing protein [Thermosynechococcus vestitus]|uniref:Tsl0972 protein n=1 Tax=Thermosynechococcus vestitus (strain NIES-2133 / IAM M-273 / BP-1) TaxID=197221 RepID=Q8DK94_THEVB|nr:DUF3134 domain-containing protein [Thermosynechococcus vestitus]BAC08524.1 tsl0972 [Thermosynechococcus vestitus BP-1]BAY51467.1 hypothetical protein NIES2134_109450 [Thermostichus vulcanus NIES-2134]
MTLYNPSLYEEPISQKNLTAAGRSDHSILEWLRQTGRLIARDANEADPIIDSALDDMGEIEEFVGDSFGDYDDEEEDLGLEE